MAPEDVVYRRLSHKDTDYDDLEDEWGTEPPKDDVQARMRTPWSRPSCNQCKKRRLECDANYPCSNCIESRCANTCPNGVSTDSADSIPLNSITTSSSSPSPPSFKLKSKLSDTFATFSTRCRVLFLQFYFLTTSLLRFLLYLTFLCIPTYYASQATRLLDTAENLRAEYGNWIEACKHANGQTSPPIRQTNGNAMEHSSRMATPDPPRVAINSSISTEPPPIPITLQDLQSTWTEYLENLKAEWNIVRTLSGIFVACSPSIFQIPEAGQDIFIRTFTFLAISRAVAGLMYGPIFFLHFRMQHAMSVHYAMLWVDEIKRHRMSVFWNPWIMFSLPTTGTLWALIFFVCAVFSYMWRTGTGAQSSDDSSIPSFNTVLDLRALLTALIIIDLIYVLITLRTLNRYKKIALERIEITEPHAHTVNNYTTADAR